MWKKSSVQLWTLRLVYFLAYYSKIIENIILEGVSFISYSQLWDL